MTAFESRMEQYPPPGGFSTTGGGVLRDFGSHVADQALQLFGPAAAVYAEVHVRPGETASTTGSSSPSGTPAGSPRTCAATGRCTARPDRGSG